MQMKEQCKKEKKKNNTEVQTHSELKSSFVGTMFCRADVPTYQQDTYVSCFLLQQKQDKLLGKILSRALTNMQIKSIIFFTVFNTYVTLLLEITYLVGNLS